MAAQEGDAVIELPFEAVVCVLQYVSLGTRLTSCAVVCSTWQTAAVTATGAVHLRNVTPERLTSFLRWLSKTKACVNGISLQNDGFAGPIRLQISDLVEALHDCGSLVQLSVSNAECLAGSLTAIHSFHALQHLTLQSVRAPEGLSPLEFPAVLLADLAHLTSLHLGPGLLVSSSSLQHLSRLKDLQQLHLTWPDPQLTATALSQLDHLPKLTHLALAGTGPGLEYSSSGLPELTRLTGLQHLALTACKGGFEAGVLTALPRLQHLELCDTRVHGYDKGVGELLACLADLQCLTELCLKYSLVCCCATDASYSALTASTSLQRLTLHDVVLPKDVWGKIFPAATHLTALRAVSIAGGGPYQPVLQQADLDRLVDCCPNLQELELDRGLHIHATLTSLTKLSGLQRLAAPNMLPDVVSRLTSLRELEVCQPSTVARHAVSLLKPLQQLQRLVVQPHCAEWQLGLGSSRLEFVNKAEPGLPSDVLSQVVAACGQRGVELPGFTQRLEEGVQQLQIAEPAGACEDEESEQSQGKHHAAGTESLGRCKCSLQ